MCWLDDQYESRLSGGGRIDADRDGSGRIVDSGGCCGGNKFSLGFHETL